MESNCGKLIDSRSRAAEQYTLITGGAGFIGTNLAKRLLSEGHRVRILDNLSRAGVEENWAWLRKTFGDRVRLERADVRDHDALRRCLTSGAAQVFHFAAQVAVTTSILDPSSDFEVNALGTLNLLEELRQVSSPPPLLFTSTNKVYGSLPDIELHTSAKRAEPVDVGGRSVDESHPLDFHTPYGCSKGAADQYVLDFARTYGIPAVVFRMSCIYGEHQFGTEDQGWLAHFLIRALEDEVITIYGDGLQVRDVLYAEDLVDAMLLAVSHVEALSGQAFNIGGGPENTLSLLELLDRIEQRLCTRPRVRFADQRPGDQRYYVSDIRKFQAATGWRPRVSVGEGIGRLYDWLSGLPTSLSRERAVAL
jgi:CDP-paratose 2-epimerase